MYLNSGPFLDQLIERAEVFRVTVPLAEPLILFGTTVITHRDFVLVRVYGAGQFGTGYGFTRGAGVDTIAREQIVPYVVGKPMGAIRQIWQNVRDSMRFFGEAGAFARALSAVDIALWDLFGKLLNAPLWRLWGGASSVIPCVAITGYYRAERTVETLREEVQRLRQAGYTQYKIPVGHDLALDIERVRVLREAAGEDTQLGIDAHGAYDSIKQVSKFISCTREFNVAFLEDPFPSSNWQQACTLARRSATHIAYGENAENLQILQFLGGPRGVDIIRPDATYHLGVTGFLQAVSIALEQRKVIYPHYFPDIHARLWVHWVRGGSRSRRQNRIR